MSGDLKVSIQFLAELEELRGAVPQIRALFQQLKGVTKEVGEQTASAAKAAGTVLLDQFGVPIKKVASELKAFAQEEAKAAGGAREAGKAAGELAGQTERVAGSATRAGNALRDMGAEGKGAASGAGSTFRATSGQADSLTQSVAGLARTLGIAYVAMQALRQGVVFLKEGLEFNAKMETAQLGIGSLIAAQAKLTDATGRELKGREALNAALGLSAEQMQKLKIAGLETVGTTEQLVVAFQQAVGVGLSVGMTLDQIRGITIRVTQAASALGVPMNQLSEEVRDLLQGNINSRNTRIATALQITPEDVRGWQSAGTMFEELTKRFEAFGLAGEDAAKTWEGVTSNVVEATQTLAGEMTKPLFSQLKEGLQGALAGVFDLKQARISEEFDGLVETGKEAFAGLGTLGVEAIQGIMDGLKGASSWLKQNKVLVQEIITNGGELVRQVFTVLATWKDISGMIGSAEQKANLLSFVIKALSLTVAGIADGLRLVASGILALGTGILASLVKPLQEFLNQMAMGLELLGKDDWAAKLRGWGQSLQGLIDAGAAKTKKMFDPLANGTGAVGSLMKAWEGVNQVQDQGEVKHQLTHQQAIKRIKELRAEIDNLAKAQDAASKTGGKNWDLAPAVQERAKKLAALNKELAEAELAGGISVKGRSSAKEEKAKSYAQEMLRLEKEGLQYLEKTTLEAQRLAKVRELDLQREKELGEIDKKAKAEHWNAGEVTKAKETVETNHTNALTAVWAKYTKDREALEADLQARLTAREDGGLAKRLEAVRKFTNDLRDRNELSKVGGKPFLTEDQILTATAAYTARERLKQVAAEVAEINKLLSERAQQLGRGLKDQEIDEVLTPYKKAGDTKGEAAGKVEKGLHRGEGAMAGMDAGITSWLVQSRNAFTVWKDFATTVLGGLESNFSNFFTNLTQRGSTFGEKTKALWMGVSQSVVQGLSKIAAAELMDWGIKKAKLAWKVIASAWETKDTAKTVVEGGVKTTANTSTAASGFFASLAALPFGTGFAIAAGLVVAMLALLKSITGRKVGGLVGERGPELTLLGEEGLEVVAPERDFKHWAASLIGMGSNLHANLAAQEGEVRGYQRQGADYALKASEAHPADEQGRRLAAMRSGQYYDMRGSFNVDTGSKEWSDLVQAGQDRGDRSGG